MRRLIAAVGTASLLMGLLAPTTIAQPISPTQPAVDGADAALVAGQLNLQGVVSGLVDPVGVVNAGDGTDRLFVIEQRGTVRVVQNRRLLAGFFLDIRGVSTGFTNGGERGLLGLAFHPSFETNEKLFVYYTMGDGDLIVAEMTANAARTSAGVGTVDAILRIEHTSQGNHNGGQLLFGPDGNLYAFTGDGGGGGDPDENAQDINSLLGKTLRITPNLSGEYSSPSGNPYDGATAGRDEIWAIGLRNPWRASFDRSTGNLWIADVGQGSWEEIDRSIGNTAGRNYGWDCREGTANFEGGCTGLTLTNPVAVYGHTGGRCSVTGGFVYRGDIYQDMAGQYLLGDYCSGEIWTLPAGAGSPALTLRRDTGILISSFGEAENGELYLTDHGGGRLYKVVAPEFSDILGSSFIDEITWLGYEGISAGCRGTSFCPTALVLREHMASFLVRARSLPATTTDYFTDDDESFHEDDINALAEAGVTKGCRATLFCPQDGVRRDEMASFIDRAFGLPTTTSDFFTDDEGSVHEAAINRVAAAGISLGCTSSTFCPSRIVTREQMAAFLFRALNP